MCCPIGHGRPAATTKPFVATEGLVLEAISRCIPQEQIEQVLERTGRQNVRACKAPAAGVGWLVLMMGLRSDLSNCNKIT